MGDESSSEDEAEEYGKTRYWDARYQKEKGHVFDWYQRWSPWLSEVVSEHIAEGSELLDVGCGVSRLGQDLVDSGYKVTAIDVSKVAIDDMRSRYPKVKYLRMNACGLSFPDETFDGAICKATLDVMACGDDGPANVLRACAEVSRVLKQGGCFVVVSSDHDLDSFLDPEKANRFDFAWTVSRHDIPKPRANPSSSSSAHNDVHYVFVCRKRFRRLLYDT